MGPKKDKFTLILFYVDKGFLGEKIPDIEHAIA